MVSRGFLSTVILVQTIVVLLLGVHIHDIANRTVMSKARDQDILVDISKLTIQSATQTHPMFAYDHASKAYILLTDLIMRHGGVKSVETNLRVKGGRVANIQHQVESQYKKVQSYIMQHIIKDQPLFNVGLNVDAGLLPDNLCISTQGSR
jgi:hypothetical protein